MTMPTADQLAMLSNGTGPVLHMTQDQGSQTHVPLPVHTPEPGLQEMPFRMSTEGMGINDSMAADRLEALNSADAWSLDRAFNAPPFNPAGLSRNQDSGQDPWLSQSTNNGDPDMETRSHEQPRQSTSTSGESSQIPESAIEESSPIEQDTGDGHEAMDNIFDSLINDYQNERELEEMRNSESQSELGAGL